ncbi:four helix bundle protein [soil metagenome]
MATIQKFEDLEIWQKSRSLCSLIFEFIRKEPFSREYKLVNQIISASGSTLDNIAEGFERGGRNEFIQFLSIAKGSAGEVKSQLYRASDRNYISNTELEAGYNLADSICKGCNGMMSYLNSSTYKGEKFKGRVEETSQDYGNLTDQFS